MSHSHKLRTFLQSHTFRVEGEGDYLNPAEELRSAMLSDPHLPDAKTKEDLVAHIDRNKLRWYPRTSAAAGYIWRKYRELVA